MQPPRNRSADAVRMLKHDLAQGCTQEGEVARKGNGPGLFLGPRAEAQSTGGASSRRPEIMFRL